MKINRTVLGIQIRREEIGSFNFDIDCPFSAAQFKAFINGIL
jgi:hypothetical protein